MKCKMKNQKVSINILLHFYNLYKILKIFLKNYETHSLSICDNIDSEGRAY